MTMTIKELVLEILYSKPVHFSRTKTIRADRVKGRTKPLLWSLLTRSLHHPRVPELCPSKGQLQDAHGCWEEQPLNEKYFIN